MRLCTWSCTKNRMNEEGKAVVIIKLSMQENLHWLFSIHCLHSPTASVLEEKIVCNSKLMIFHSLPSYDKQLLHLYFCTISIYYHTNTDMMIVSKMWL